jgi:hypothetical protein
VEDLFDRIQNQDDWVVPQNQSSEIHDRMLSYIQSHIEEIDVPAPKIIYMRKSFWWAAAVLLLGFFGIYKLLQRPVTPVTIAGLNKKADIAPGQTGAILTLANGKKIVLDSAGNGVLAQQAGVNVLQQNGQLAYSGQSQAVLYNTMSTPVGRTFRLVLPDGTRVWLNASSSITFPTAFEGKERQVTITGEAYFEVVHRVTQKFLVKTSHETVEDIGTRFDIDSYSDEPSIKTTLLEGAVKVAALGNTTNDATVLHPGEQAVLSTSIGKIKIDKEVDLDEVIAWKNGVFRFNSVDIHTIMRQAARWYDMDVSYIGDIHATFSGGISRNVNASQLFHILESTDKVSFEIIGKKIIVKPKESRKIKSIK